MSETVPDPKLTRTVTLKEESVGPLLDVLDRYFPGSQMSLALPAREAQIAAMNDLRAALSQAPGGEK